MSLQLAKIQDNFYTYSIDIGVWKAILFTPAVAEVKLNSQAIGNNLFQNERKCISKKKIKANLKEWLREIKASNHPVPAIECIFSAELCDKLAMDNVCFIEFGNLWGVG